jgi:hypothetical protein
MNQEIENRMELNSQKTRKEEKKNHIFLVVFQKGFVYSPRLLAEKFIFALSNLLRQIIFFYPLIQEIFMDIEKSYPTGTPADQMKQIMTDNVLSRDDVKMFFGDTTWDGNTLNFTSGLVSAGKFEIVDNEVKVQVDLSMFGKMAKGQIEGTLEKTFSKLPS